MDRPHWSGKVTSIPQGEWLVISDDNERIVAHHADLREALRLAAETGEEGYSVMRHWNLDKHWVLPTALAAFCIVLVLPIASLAQGLPSRQMDELNWMHFRQIVPARVKTVIVTTGTLEPHGVVNNGADNTAPVAIANAIAADVNALIAPHLPYGVTGSMAPYPGAMTIPEEAYRPFVRAVLEGMVKNKFKNIVIINGHGGPQTAILTQVAGEIAQQHSVNTLVVNWWALASDVTLEVFGEDGGHAGINETAFVQAVNPKLVHKELYTGKDMATANPTSGAWAATPFPSSITLYKDGQGWPKDFNQAKADEYFKKVVAKIRGLVQDTLKKWEMAGFN